MSALILIGGLLAVPALGALCYLWWRRPTWLLAAYLLLMPFHTVTFQVLAVELRLSGSVTTLIQSWKDVLLAALLVRALLPALLTGRLRMAHPWVLPLLVVYTLVGVWGVIISPSLVAGLYGFRGTFEPLALLVIALSMPLGTRWLRRMPAAMLLVGAAASAFAIFQVFVLSYDFLWRYYAIDGRISNAYSFAGGTFQRAMGTFSSPNQFSLYLSFLIVLGVNLALRLPRWRWPTMALVGLLAATLLLTVSRSGWLACAAGIFLSGLIWRRKAIFVVPVVVLALITLPLGLALGLDEHLIRTVSLSDPSAAYRLDINRQNLETVLQNPLGVGLGIVGARALNTRILGAGGQLYATESYYFQTAMELGIVGLVLFVVLLVSCGYVAYCSIFRLRDRYWRALAVSACACIAAAMTHAFFIADLQDLTVGSYLWFLVGLAMRLPAIEAAETAAEPAARPSPAPTSSALPAPTTS